MLREEEPEEVSYSDWIRSTIPPPYEFSLMYAIKEFKPETPKVKEVFHSKRQILETSLEDSDEVVLWSGGCIVTTTKNGINQLRKDREREDWKYERNPRLDYRDYARGGHRTRTRQLSINSSPGRDSEFGGDGGSSRNKQIVQGCRDDGGDLERRELGRESEDVTGEESRDSWRTVKTQNVPSLDGVKMWNME